ncbi:MAG: tRNA preQ1(34) S-adenosylmethionine ribosyltransferase-isomerase QueA [FCB group bacterium]|nr:tRNA preQ1(34) S-adenosylmethionine ribosyltransferase-isomerase QueA [FCB group bacterium]
MKTSEFNYHLPPELVAQYPAEKRTASRMLVLDRKTGTISDRKFIDLPEILDSTYFLVLNDSRVFKARLFGHRSTGGKVEIFLVRRMKKNSLSWRALLRPSGRIKSGEKIWFDGKNHITAIDDPGPVERTITFEGSAEEKFIISRYGKIPLPPYIRREAEATDRDRYQTVYAAESGSVAAPTAGLHFSSGVMSSLRQKKIAIEKVTLHVGPGTFKPVTASEVKDHIVDPEFAVVTKKTADTVNLQKDEGKKLLAVGTTSVRTIEATAETSGRIKPMTEMVDLFIYPPYKYRAVDAILTNFHLPQSSLLMLVAAFCGQEFLKQAYLHAVAEKYRFYSYGDCMLIL